LYATTRKFLDDLGLRSLTELPPLTEIERVMDFEQTALPQAESPQFGAPTVAQTGSQHDSGSTQPLFELTVQVSTDVLTDAGEQVNVAEPDSPQGHTLSGSDG
jgi:hypothetical protein